MDLAYFYVKLLIWGFICEILGSWCVNFCKVRIFDWFFPYWVSNLVMGYVWICWSETRSLSTRVRSKLCIPSPDPIWWDYTGYFVIVMWGLICEISRTWCINCCKVCSFDWFLLYWVSNLMVSYVWIFLPKQPLYLYEIGVRFDSILPRPHLVGLQWIFVIVMWGLIYEISRTWCRNCC